MPTVGGDPRQGHRFEAVGVGDLGRRSYHLRLGLGAHSAFAIAASIAAPGFSTTLPCPGASRAGSNARSALALSSSVGLCQVAKPGSGKRGFIFAEVATPPRVEYASPE